MRGSSALIYLLSSIFYSRHYYRCATIIVFIFLANFRSVLLSQSLILIEENSSWRYFSQQNSPPLNWAAPGFVDSEWAQGNAVLGYGVSNTQTIIDYGNNAENKFPTAYFRKQIHLNGAATLSNTLLRIKRDDGIVLYVNGVERYRNNMPTGAITHVTPASNLAGNNGSDWIYCNLPDGIFNEGVNTIAAEVHQYSLSDPDLAFDCSILASQTDLIPPQVTGFFPPDGGINVPTSSNVSIMFNEPINVSSGWIYLKYGNTVIESLQSESSGVLVNVNSIDLNFTILPSGSLLTVEFSSGMLSDYAGNTFNAPIQWTFTTECTSIACFESLLPDEQSEVLLLPESHTFQVIFQTGDELESSIFPDNPDFTGYISQDGAYTGYLCINHENLPQGGVLVTQVEFDDSLKIWQKSNSTEVDFSSLGGTMRNCSGAITPWGTMISGEEVRYATTDLNADEYLDSGWLVEINPETAQICSYDSASPQKLWALGRMAHENAAVSFDDSRTVYFGEDDPAGCLYKFVAEEAGNLSSGNLFVLKLDSTLISGLPSGETGTWLEVQNDSPEQCNFTYQWATALGATVFNGIEDVEIGPDGRIYFASKNFGKIYRFADSGAGVSSFEVFAGGTSYPIITASDTVWENWGLGNDNLAFDGDGNLWVLQDGGRNHIWLIRNGHSQNNPRIELFATTPSGSEPTGITFSKDYRYMFISFQHPDSLNIPQQDATGHFVRINKGSVIVVARKEHLGRLNDSLGNVEYPNQPRVTIFPNPSKGRFTLSFVIEEAQKVEVEFLSSNGLALSRDVFFASSGKTDRQYEVPFSGASQIIRIKGEYFTETLKHIRLD